MRLLGRPSTLGLRQRKKRTERRVSVWVTTSIFLSTLAAIKHAEVFKRALSLSLTRSDYGRARIEFSRIVEGFYKAL